MKKATLWQCMLLEPSKSWHKHFHLDISLCICMQPWKVVTSVAHLISFDWTWLHQNSERLFVSFTEANSHWFILENRVHDSDYCSMCIECRGYLAPEYASLGQLSEKVDVFSFGILVLEILSGRQNIDETKPLDEVYLSKWVLHYTFLKIGFSITCTGSNYGWNNSYQLHCKVKFK